jgi:hypothetical protein
MRPTRCRLRHSRNQVHVLWPCMSYTQSFCGTRCCCHTCRERRCACKPVIAALVVLAVNLSCRPRLWRRRQCLRRHCHEACCGRCCCSCYCCRCCRCWSFRKPRHRRDPTHMCSRGPGMPTAATAAAFASASAARATSSPSCLAPARRWHATNTQSPRARGTNNIDCVLDNRIVYMRGGHPSLRKGQ